MSSFADMRVDCVQELCERVLKEIENHATEWKAKSKKEYVAHWNWWVKHWPRLSRWNGWELITVDDVDDSDLIRGYWPDEQKWKLRRWSDWVSHYSKEKALAQKLLSLCESQCLANETIQVSASDMHTLTNMGTYEWYGDELE